MRIRFLLSSLLALSIIGCSTPMINTSQDFSDLEKEYKSFSTKALSDAYVKRMFGKYLAPVNSVQLTRQLEFSRYLKAQNDISYETSLKSMFAQTPSLYDTMTGTSSPDIQNKMSTESATFGTYVTGLSPYPGTPLATTATNIAATSFMANWGTVSGATGYKLFVDGTEVYSGSNTSFSVTGLTTGATYNYYVKAINNAGNSGNSNTVSVILNPAVPSAPTTNAASNITQTSFTANWNTVSGATSYKLKVDSGLYTDVGNVTSFDISGLTAGTTHTYSVQAVNISGTSTASSNRSVTLLPATPNAPVAKIASNLTATSFRANWNSVSGATSYKLFIDGVEAYTGTALYYNKSSVASGSTHTYYVQAVNAGGTSGNSNEISVSLLTHLTEIQSIPSGKYGYDFETFVIGTNTYMGTTYYHNGSTNLVDAKISKWNNSLGQFEDFQFLPANGSVDFEFFTIGSNHYLALSNYFSDSKIYKWNGSTFVEFQTIVTAIPNDWEFFTIGSDYYLGITNGDNNSKIYKWNGSTFIELQTVTTSGPYDMEKFNIGTDIYLAVASYSSSTADIFKWNNSTAKFDTTTAFQSLASGNPTGVQSFVIGTDTYLAVANNSGGTSNIYKWNTSTNTFNTTPFQALSIDAGYDWEYFTVGSDVYLAGANAGSGNPSNIYKWNGTNFTLWQTVSAYYASKLEHFIIGTTHYLAVYSQFNTDSKIYRLD